MRTASPEVIERFQHGFECWNRHELDEIRAYYDRIWHAWAGFGWTPQEIIDLGDDSYAVVTRIEAQGRSSGVPVGTEFTIVYRVVEGRIAHAVYYPCGKAGLEAAQLQG